MFVLVSIASIFVPAAALVGVVIIICLNAKQNNQDECTSEFNQTEDEQEAQNIHVAGIGDINASGTQKASITPLSRRTLATSNFKHLYESARVPEDHTEFFTVVKYVILEYALCYSIPETTALNYYSCLHDECWKRSRVRKGDLQTAAEHAWYVYLPSKACFCGIIGR